MRAPVVFGDDLDVLMTLASVQHVLNPEIGEMNALIEVREVVLVRPFLDLARVAIGSSVAVGSAAIVFLQPLLVLAFEFLLEHDPTDVGPLVTQMLLLAQVGAIELGVVRQLARAADAGVERLLALVAAIAAMGFQEVAAALRERHRMIAALKGDEPHQTFIAQVTQVRLAQRFVSHVVEIALGHHPKRPDGRKGPAVVTVQFVPMIAIDDDLALPSARQVEAFDERVSRLYVPFTRVAIAVTRIVGVARIDVFAIRSGVVTQFNPWHLDVADVLVAVARIEVEHRSPRR